MEFPIRRISPADFPSRLQEIPHQPKALFVRGQLPAESTVCLCVVGSRACSPYGRRMTHSLIAGLAGQPVTIVSGLALGIDAQAHQAALDAGLATVAVLPSSCDDHSIYPATNRALSRAILERGGTLISEHAEPHRPRVYDFPARNRIMAGLSNATLIIEASEKSGTLITARLALDYNRDVLAIPHELGRESGAGPNRLLREGATLVRDSADILQALGLQQTDPVQAKLPTDLTESETKVLHALSETLERDELIVRTQLSAQEANIALSSLLLRGLLVERMGKVEKI